MESIGAVLAIVNAKFSVGGDIGSATRKDRALAISIIRLLEAHGEANEEVEFVEEVLLHLEDYDPDYESEDRGGRIRQTAVILDEPTVSFSGGSLVSAEHVRRAARFYQSSSSGTRPLTTMTKHFRFFKTQHDVDKLQRFIENEGTAINLENELNRLEERLFATFVQKSEEGVALHDYNLRALALRLKQDLNLPTFKASPRWITKFKKRHGIVSRRITKFITRRTARETTTPAQRRAFVEKVRSLGFAPNAMANADQSPVAKELHSARTLSLVGVRHVQRRAQSKDSLTHSYTILPLIFADGTLHPKLYVVLAERYGFPDNFDPEAFQNLVVRCHTSHIMTKELMFDWLETCVFTAEMPRHLLLVLDAWPSFKAHEDIKELVPRGKTVHIENIPEGATRFIQPLDVYFFGVVKDFLRRIHSHILDCNLPFAIARRNNLLRVLEILWNQFCHPSFRPFAQYAWRKAGYIDESPETFDTPMDVCFNRRSLQRLCEAATCDQASFMCCAYCEQVLCFEHFINDRHYH